MSTTGNQESPPAQQGTNGQQQSPQQSTPAPNPTPVPQAISSVGENLQCQWANCGERCTSPEALYEHVCERHVGRKSTNNLNLTCQWGSCRTTTVKRDHITSHIRVHVPLKPHKCDFCGKAFKRPQDLKKHVKTHADDSMLGSGRSPDMGPGARPGNNHYALDNKQAGAYYPAHMAQGHDYGAHGQSQYYQPPQTHPSQYGGVYYPISAANQAAAEPTFENRKRGYDALSNFFNDIRSSRVNPRDYNNFSQRLFDLQTLQLPEIIPAQVPAYQPVTAMAGGYGGHGGDEPIQSYSLPPMGNVKSRTDLTSIDQLLAQMQSTIYENENSISAAGVGQPGSHYVGYRTSDSPTGVSMASAHANAPGIYAPRAHHTNSISSTAESVHSVGGTPALTPPSSAQSYTSGGSPLPSSQGISPTHGGMYPTLPTSSGMDNYGVSTSAAPASTLGSVFDHDDRRRYSGGTLQRARPAPRRGSGDAMDVSSEGSATPPATAGGMRLAAKKASPTENVIDPSLEGPPATPKTAEEALKSPTSVATVASAAAAAAEEKQDQKYTAWLENMRLIEYLRDLVRRMREEWPQEGVSEPGEKPDVEMGESSGAAGEGETKGGVESITYPSLKDEVAA